MANYMDLDECLATSPVNDSIICGICLSILNNPLECDSCQHTFCRACITKWTAKHKTCPIDRQIITKLLPAPRPIRRLLAQVTMKCLYAADGCKTIVGVGNFLNHVEFCKYNPKQELKCNNCELAIKRCELATHNCKLELLKQINSVQYLLYPKKLMFSADITESKAVLKKELEAINDYLYTKESTLPTGQSKMYISLPFLKEYIISDWLSTLPLCKITMWGELQANPNLQLLTSVKSALVATKCSTYILPNLLHYSKESQWPKKINAVYKRIKNYKIMKKYVCRQIPNELAVVVMFDENEHMPEDFIKYPGLVFTFNMGIEKL